MRRIFYCGKLHHRRVFHRLYELLTNKQFRNYTIIKFYLALESILLGRFSCGQITKGHHDWLKQTWICKVHKSGYLSNTDAVAKWLTNQKR
jgi:hypothetical protein